MSDFKVAFIPGNTQRVPGTDNEIPEPDRNRLSQDRNRQFGTRYNKNTNWALHEHDKSLRSWPHFKAMNSFLNFGHFLLVSFVGRGNINTPIKGTKVPTTTTSEIMTAQPPCLAQSSHFSCHIIVAFSHFLFREMTFFFVTFFFSSLLKGIFSRPFSLSNNGKIKKPYFKL